MIARVHTKDRRGKLAENAITMENQYGEDGPKISWKINMTTAIRTRRLNIEEAQEQSFWKFGMGRRQQLENPRMKMKFMTKKWDKEL